jgi:hypothetical protein
MPESTKELSGEELDRAVAERVMGNTLPEVWSDPTVGPSHGDPGGYRIGVRPYSSSIEAAMKVVEHFQKQEYMVSVNASSAGGWWCCMYPPAEAFIESATVESPALAICRAALAAIGSKE